MPVGRHVFVESEKELVPLLSLGLQPRQRTRLLVSLQRSTSSRGSSRPCTHFRARNTANPIASTTQPPPQRKPKQIRRHHARRHLTFIGTSTARKNAETAPTANNSAGNSGESKRRRRPRPINNHMGLVYAYEDLALRGCRRICSQFPRLHSNFLPTWLFCGARRR